MYNYIAVYCVCEFVPEYGRNAYELGRVLQ